ncbi:PfkB family carbohydrate kinase [Nonomuraea recticatena]|uniref:PfkB family carbohydrate kinase n=1 Tax=Nonomuraea recticatena TaxID=46178 RepID=UPI0036221109
MRVLGFGDNIVDRFVDRGIDYPGGNSVNVAVYARRLGLEAAYLGVFGDDDLGGFLREAIAAQGVAVDRCVVKEGRAASPPCASTTATGSSSGGTAAASRSASRWCSKATCSTTCRPSTWSTRASTPAARASCPSWRGAVRS